MEEYEVVEIIVGYGVQVENGENLIYYRGMYGAWNETNYTTDNYGGASGGCIYAWLVKLAVF